MSVVQHLSESEGYAAYDLGRTNRTPHSLAFHRRWHPRIGIQIFQYSTFTEML